MQYDLADSSIDGNEVCCNFLAGFRNLGNMTTRKSEARAEGRSSALNSDDVIEEVRRNYDRLTHSQKRIAEFIIEHPQTVAFSTVDQMAARLDVNPSTVVRFTYRLGLNGFPDLQERMRELVRGQLSRTGNPIAGRQGNGAHLDGTSFGASFSHDWQNLHRTIEGIDPEGFGRAVNLVTRARRVYVTAGFATFPVANYFGLILDRLRPDVTLLASSDAFATVRLAEIKFEDCVVAFTFPRYAAATHRIASWSKEQGAKVIAVTDSPISAIGQIADVVLLAASSGAGMQNSLVAPMAVANALLNGVQAGRGTAALERYSRHDRLMNQWDAFLLKLDETD